ncbi:MAG TPA: ribonuclease E/G [Hyphomonadaceae bacterium]|nr:ribonuclease E/G [Hyphomonadaceae bacterium]HPI48490.1 ribonuclease E/G [Hyphomonadaceae bacterium]
MKATLCIDDAVGEHRRALLDSTGRPFRLEIERWSERDSRAKLDEIWWGRVRARMPGNRGWFVDLGLEAAGVIEPTRAAAVTEGALLAVRVKSEAWADKGPLLSLADMSPSAPRPDGPARHAAAKDDPFLRGVEIVATVTGADARRDVDAAVEEAQQRIHVLHGGGDIAIDATRGMTVIDVDSGSRASGADAEAFALDLNLAAADEAARQLALRGAGGLAAIDFVGMQAAKSRRAVAESFRKLLAARLGRTSEVLELSPLGVCEAAIARRIRPVRDALAAPTAEREALDALRAIETVGWAARGARIHARVSTQSAAWLELDPVGWKDQLANRIGARWAIEAGARAPGNPEVWSA